MRCVAFRHDASKYHIYFYGTFYFHVEKPPVMLTGCFSPSHCRDRETEICHSMSYYQNYIATWRVKNVFVCGRHQTTSIHQPVLLIPIPAISKFVSSKKTILNQCFSFYTIFFGSGPFGLLRPKGLDPGKMELSDPGKMELSDPEKMELSDLRQM